MCVQYIGGYHEYIGGYHEYIEGCSVHRGIIVGNIMTTSGDTMSISGGYHEYIGGCSLHQGDIMMHVGE